MKKIIALLIGLSIAFCFVGCGDDSTNDEKPDDGIIDEGIDMPIIPILPSN